MKYAEDYSWRIHGGRDVIMSSLVGHTIVAIDTDDAKRNIWFTLEGGEILRMFHDQDCCESVYIESIVGNLTDLLGTPLLVVEVVSWADGQDGVPPPILPRRESWMDDEDYADHCTYAVESYRWTFYKFATIRGYVDIRWYGTSNGYYGEGVDLRHINIDEEEGED